MAVTRNAAVGKIVLLQFGDAGVRAQVPAAGDDSGGPSGLEKLGGARGPVAVVVVVAENHDGVGGDGAFVHDPEAAGHAQQRMPREINEENKEQRRRSGTKGERKFRRAAMHTDETRRRVGIISRDRAGAGVRRPARAGCR